MTTNYRLTAIKRCKELIYQQDREQTTNDYKRLQTMKPEIIHLSESLLMIDLPVGARSIKIVSYHVDEIPPMLLYWPDNVAPECIALPPGEYEIVGTGTLTNDQAKKCIGDLRFAGDSGFVFTAIKSLESLIESKGFHLRNPRGEKPEYYWHKGTRGVMGSAVRNPNYMKWQAAEAKTLHNPVFIVKK